MARKKMVPPRPPWPPSGPPLGMYLRRMNDRPPSPPLPPVTVMSSTSLNAMRYSSWRLRQIEARPHAGAAPSETCGCKLTFGEPRAAQSAASACDSTSLMLTKRPLAPLSWNLTVPSRSAKRVKSLPRPTLKPGLNLVPRCLTSMLPASTTWPSKRLTPRRCEWLSRPFLELPTPFLCAISSSPKVSRPSAADRCYADFGELLPVPGVAPVVALGLELVDVDLVAAPVTDYLGLDGGAIDVRRTDLDAACVVTTAEQQDRQLYLRPGFRL